MRMLARFLLSLTLLASLAAWAGPSVITSPAAGSTLTSQSVDVQWNDSGASLYQVWVGNSPGTYDVGYFPAAGTTATSTTVSGLPTDGRTLHVRLWSKIGGIYAELAKEAYKPFQRGSPDCI